MVRNIRRVFSALCVGAVLFTTGTALAIEKKDISLDPTVISSSLQILDEEVVSPNTVGSLVITDYQGDGGGVVLSDMDLKSLLYNITLSTSASSSVRAGDIQTQVWDLFRSYGFTEEMTAALMGNIQQECAFDLDNFWYKSNGVNCCGGMFQWEYTKGSDNRLMIYMNEFCSQNNYELWSPESQVAYFVYESQMSKGPDNAWLGIFKNANNASKVNKGTDNDYRVPNFTSYEEMRTCTDILQGTINISANYCRAGKPMNDRRYAYALAFYEKYRDRGTSSSNSEITISRTPETVTNIPGDMPKEVTISQGLSTNEKVYSVSSLHKSVNG